MKTAYRIDSNGIYIGSVELDVSDKSPLEPDVYLFPAGVVEDAPPAPNAGEFVKRENGVWVIFRVPVESQHVPLVPPPPTTQDLLNKLDADNTLTQRNLRETIMLMNEAFKLVSSNSVDLSNIPGVAQVYAVEAQAAALRAQL